MQQHTYTSYGDVLSMSKSKKKLASLNLLKAEGAVIVKLTPSATWHGGDEFIGAKEAAVLIDGSYYDEDGGKFVMGEGHWELVG